MPALIEPSPQALHSHSAQHHQTPSRLLSQVIATPLGTLTDGLAQVLGNGMAAPVIPNQAQHQPFQMVPPTAQLAAQHEARDTASMSVDQLLQKLQPSPEAYAQQSNEGLEAMRMQMFGRYYQEIEGRMVELTKSLEGGVGRARRAMLERVDELGAALHRDMVALRQETQTELEELKRDVFTTVMSLSAINDKLSLADSRNRETWVAVTKALTDRIDHQAKSQAAVIDGFRKGIDEGMEQRVVKVVEGTLMRLAASRRAPAPAEA
jgi:predicted transcriptional regulator